ncbi:hypothetical protein APSETT444_008920 [Aspergillus pseudonomiae]
MSENRRPLPPPSLMVRKFLEYKASEDPRLPFASQARSPGYSETDWPQTPLSEGYTTKLWGKYPVLVKRKPFQPVDGLAYKIRLREDWDRLLAYHSDRYDLGYILIDFLDTGENEVVGFAFEWKGDPEELRNGSFSLEKWLQERDLTGSK